MQFKFWSDRHCCEQWVDGPEVIQTVFFSWVGCAHAGSCLFRERGRCCETEECNEHRSEGKQGHSYQRKGIILGRSMRNFHIIVIKTFLMHDAYLHTLIVRFI